MATPPRPQESRAVSVWPFIGMIGMAATFFLYATSGLVAPGWGVALLLLVWFALFVVAVRWWTPHPRRVVLVPLVALVVWFAALTAGGAWLGWTA